MKAVFRDTYRLTASACAALVSRVPTLERPLVRLGARVWNWPRGGRFYRSVAGRYADRLRQSGSPFRRVMVGDTPLMVDVTEFTTTTLFFGNVPYEPVTTDYLRALLRPGDVFVDVGANHGYFTLVAAALVGTFMRDVAIEPNPTVYEQLRTHVRLNGFDGRVGLLEQALSDGPDAAARLFVSQCATNSGLSSLTPAASLVAVGSLSPEHTIAVRTETFDGWFATSGLSRVDVVKIDTEGAEALVVRGMSAALRSCQVGAVICETAWDSPAHGLLCGSGLVPQRLETVGSPTNIAYTRQAVS
jgi:FkbM family methyltransferase